MNDTDEVGNKSKPEVREPTNASFHSSYNEQVSESIPDKKMHYGKIEASLKVNAMPILSPCLSKDVLGIEKEPDLPISHRSLM